MAFIQERVNKYLSCVMFFTKVFVFMISFIPHNSVQVGVIIS